jgi:hypothetical protein
MSFHVAIALVPIVEGHLDLQIVVEALAVGIEVLDGDGIPSPILVTWWFRRTSASTVVIVPITGTIIKVGIRIVVIGIGGHTATIFDVDVTFVDITFFRSENINDTKCLQ